MTRSPTPISVSPPTRERRIALVLGGGGMKGFAHIGVIQALEDRGIVPTLYAGTSIGAMMAAARVAGMSATELVDRAQALKRKDLFRINHFGMLMERMRSPSIYLEEPLRELTHAVVPEGTFADLPGRLLVNTVDIERGMEVIWGLDGLRDVSVRDAVYASCALPGYFPPGRVADRLCVDGGVVDNLPVAIVAGDADLIIAVDVGSTDLRPIQNALSLGFANIYLRAAATMMHALQQFPLTHWAGPPMVLVRPRVGEDWLSFGNIAGTIREGRRAALKALEDLDAFYDQPGGVYPRRLFEIEVDRDKCVGCKLCVALAPNTMAMDGQGKAYALAHTANWSPADGEFVQSCPTAAIVARKVDRILPPKPAAAGERGAA